MKQKIPKKIDETKVLRRDCIKASVDKYFRQVSSFLKNRIYQPPQTCYQIILHF